MADPTVTLHPNGAGATVQWTPTSGTNWAAVVTQDALNVYAGDDGKTDEDAMETVTVASASQVVVQVLCYLASDADYNSLGIQIYMGGAWLTEQIQVPGAGWGTLSFTFAKTGAPWTQADVDALQIRRIKHNSDSDYKSTIYVDRSQAVLTYVAPTVNQTVTPSVQVLTEAQQTPTINRSALLLPAVQTLTVAQLAPTVGLSPVVLPSVLALTLAQLEPTVYIPADIYIYPAALELLLAQSEPTISLSVVATPAALELLLVQPAPAIGLGVLIEPSMLALTLAQESPAIALSAVISPAALELLSAQLGPEIVLPIVTDVRLDVSVTPAIYADVELLVSVFMDRVDVGVTLEATIAEAINQPVRLRCRVANDDFDTRALAPYAYLGPYAEITVTE
jgi:hypothetical protein